MTWLDCIHHLLRELDSARQGATTEQDTPTRDMIRRKKELVFWLLAQYKAAGQPGFRTVLPHLLARPPRV
jgi:hypothetical protein